MVYSNKFVMCVLLNGQPQKELGNGQVNLPFGAEYALRLRNKNDRRAVVKIYIDGENVSGGGYVVNAHDHVDIKRHHDKDRAFKFVSLDSPEAFDHGKDGPNDDKVKGTIEARFYLEKKRPEVVYRDVHHHHDHHHHHHHRRDVWHYNDHWIKPAVEPYQPYYGMSGGGATCAGGPSGIYTSDAGDQLLGGAECTSKGLGDIQCSTGGARGMSAGGTVRTSSLESATPASFNSGPELKDGATVEGYSTGQNFYSTWVDTEDQYTSLKIFLQGFDGPVEAVETHECCGGHQHGHGCGQGKGRKRPAKDRVIDDLEAENERLRRELAEIENERLKKELEARKNE
jgi:hypothetical protein